MLSPGQARTVAETLALSVADVAAQVPPELAERLLRAGEALAPGDGEPSTPHPGLPPVGACLTQQRQVTAEDTAAALGHPDPGVDVLGSPRIALWFELAASALLPAPSDGLTHVGVGIVVHHLGTAGQGERVEVRAALRTRKGRHGLFVCAARVGDRLIALGAHHRVLLDRS
jgi:predicted thioesterase